MNNAISMIKDLVSGLTGIFVGLIGLGVVSGIVFGDLLGVDWLQNLAMLVLLVY